MNQSSFWISFWLSKLLVAVGPMLATVGITVDQSVFLPQATGALMTVAGLIWGAVTHVKALAKTPPALLPQDKALSLPRGLNAFAAVMVLGFGLALTGCGSTQSANITTTAGSTAATVDSNPGIGAGAAVTSTLTPSSELVSAVTGTLSLTLSLPASGSGTAAATFKNTVAFTLQNDLSTYSMSVANMFEQNLPTVLSDIGNVAALTADTDTMLQQYGLVPVNKSQNSVATNIVSIASKVSGGASSLVSLLSGIQATGTVPAISGTSSTGTTTYASPSLDGVLAPEGWADGKDAVAAR